MPNPSTLERDREPLTADAIRAMPAGREMDALINKRFIGWDSARSWSQSRADAAELMICLVSRLEEGDFHLEHRNGEWSASTCFRNGQFEDWVHGETFPLAVCRAALLTTLEAQP